MATDAEINESVARKLGILRCECHDPAECPGGHEPLKDYCHSIEAAWEIIEHLAVRDVVTKIEQHGLGVPSYFVTMQKIPSSVYFSADDKLAPRAICLAFLKVP